MQYPSIFFAPNSFRRDLQILPHFLKNSANLLVIPNDRFYLLKKIRFFVWRFVMCFKMPDLIACQLQCTSHPVMMSQAMLKQVFSLCIFIYFFLVHVVVQCAYFLSKKIFAFCIWTPKRTSFSDIYSTLLVHCAYQGVMFELCSTHDEEASNVATN